MKIERIGPWPRTIEPVMSDGIPDRFRRGYAPPVSASGSVLALWFDEAERTAGAVLGAARTAAWDTGELDYVGLDCGPPGKETGVLRLVVKYRSLPEPSAVISAAGWSPEAHEWFVRAARALATMIGVPYREVCGNAGADSE